MKSLSTLIVMITLVSSTALPQQKGTKTGRVEGVVVSTAETPVPFANVTVPAESYGRGKKSNFPSYTTVADAAGRFVIENVSLESAGGMKRNSVYLIAERTGFLRTFLAGPFDLTPGETRKSVTVRMAPQSVISGRVLDDTGEPVANVHVTVRRRSYQDGVRQLIPVNSGSTNDRGEFRIPDLPPGRYYVVANRGVRANLRNGLFWAPTYFPDSTEWQTAIPIDLHKEQELDGIQIHLRSMAGFSVKGNVRNINGQSVGGASVYAVPEPIANGPRVIYTNLRSAQTGRDGSFEFQGLPSGVYVFEAISSSRSSPKAEGRAPVNIEDRNVPDIRIALNSSVTVHGTIQADGMDLDSLPRRVVVRLINASGLSHPDSPWVSSRKGGSFEIKNVVPGRYHLEFSILPPDAYVKSIQLSGGDASHGPLDLTSGDTNIKVVLAKDTGSVSGVARNAAGETDRYVMTLWSADPKPEVRTNGVIYGVTGLDGAFAFHELPPGTYYAALWEDLNIDRSLIQAREFLNLMTINATRLVVQAGTTVQADLKPISSSRVRAVEEMLP